MSEEAPKYDGRNAARPTTSQLIKQLEALRTELMHSADMLRSAAGTASTERERRLLTKAGEAQGAAEMVDDWIAGIRAGQ